MRSLFTWCSSCFLSLQHNLAVWATLPYKSTIKKMKKNEKKNPCFGHLFCGEGKGQRLPLLNPVMSSMTSVPHRIGGTRHKFPENSPFLPTLAAPWWTSCCKKKSFSSTSNVKHRDKSHSIYIPALLQKTKQKKKQPLAVLSWIWRNKAIGIMEMVRKKIQILQQQLDEAEDRELNVQKEFETERGLREVVRNAFPLLFYQT